jgi:hypothetical protein
MIPRSHRSGRDDALILEFIFEELTLDESQQTIYKQFSRRN